MTSRQVRRAQERAFAKGREDENPADFLDLKPASERNVKRYLNRRVNEEGDPLPGARMTKADPHTKFRNVVIEDYVFPTQRGMPGHVVVRNPNKPRFWNRKDKNGNRKPRVFWLSARHPAVVDRIPLSFHKLMGI